MYLIYIDESGKSNFSDPHHYILSALIVNERKWKKIDIDIQNLKLNFLIDITEELHTVEIADFKRKYKHLSKDERLELLKDISYVISENKCTLISAIIDKNKINIENQNSKFVEKWAWRLLLERIEKFLLKRRHLISKEYGLIVVDSINEKENIDIIRKMRHFRQEGTMFIQSNYLIEDPFFVSSEFRNMVQLVDFVAWISRKEYYLSQKLHKLSKNEKFYRELFDKISSKFDKNKLGNYMGAGYKIHP